MEMMANQIRILIIQANPPGTTWLDSDLDLRNLSVALSTALERDRFAPPIFQPALRIKDLSHTLRRHQPHILHFIGHGDGQGGLLLNAPDDQRGAPLTDVDLADLIRIYQDEATTPLKLVLLAGCCTAGAAQLLSAHVACAIGTTDNTDDAAMRDLTLAFYGALADGRTVPNALEEARAHLRHHCFLKDAATVQLYTQPDCDPNAFQPAMWLTASYLLPQVSPELLPYLRSLFDQPWATVSLADIQRERQDQAQLLDLYVPLPVDFTIVLKIEGGKIVDWQAQSTQAHGDRQSTYDECTADGNSGRAVILEKQGKLREWSNLRVGEPELTRIVLGIQKKITTRAANGRTTKDGKHNWYMEAHDAASVQPHFVLRGDPGSGKSSFLRHLALCLAGELRRHADDQNVPENANRTALRDWLLGAYVPLYIEMRTLVNTVFPTLPANDSQPILRPTAEALWTYVAQELQFARYVEELRGMAETGDLILLLDGLDEVPQGDRSNRREQIQGFVYALVTRYPNLRMIITSRPNAYQPDKWALNGFGYATLKPLQFDRLRELSLALFTAASVTKPSHATTKFIQTLRDHPCLDTQLHANPLLFTLLAALWLADTKRRLPETHAELYRAAVDLLLDRWTRRRLPEPSVADWLGLAPEELRPLLATLAYTVHTSEEMTAQRSGQVYSGQQDPTTFSIETLFLILYRNRYHQHFDEISDYLTQQAGLLISTEPEKFRFSHRSFQEHLAASELICREPMKRQPPIPSKRPFPVDLLERVGKAPAHWENVLYLAADELSRTRRLEFWTLLHGLCQPYLHQNEEGPSAFLALKIAERHHLFTEIVSENMQEMLFLAPLQQTALKLLTDNVAFPTPADRNIAGELLGQRPEHDTRPGVGCSSDGLPAFDWVKIPESDDQGHRQFIYQNDECRTEPTFWIARYPVTYRQFQAFIDAKDGCTNPAWWEGLSAPEGHKRELGDQAFKFWNHPRERVSWYDAIAFCRWLTAKAIAKLSLLPIELQGRNDWRLTLPTELQWEKTARGFQGLHYPWGSNYIAGRANINETRWQEGPHYLQKTSPVGMYPHNRSPFGVVDLSGNVWEWCLNEYHNPERVQETGDATRVVRGGAWGYVSTHAALFYRGNGYLYPRFNGFGFRPVVVVGGGVPVG